MKIGFRAVRKNDLVLLMGWRNQEKVRRTCRDDRLINMRDQRKWFKRISLSEKDVMFLVLSKNNPVGICGLNHIDRKNGSAEISYHLGVKINPAVDVTIGLEVYKFLKAKGFMEYGLNRLWGEAFSFNEGGIALAMAAGFKKEGILRENVYRNCEYWDSILLGMLKKEYCKRSGGRLYGKDR